MVAPPLYRSLPHWYQRGLTQIASRFSLTFNDGKPDNLFLLPSFSCQDLLPDGAFLTPVSGLHYVLQLFDSSEAALELVASSGNAQFGSVKETVRTHDDRMTYIENRHVHLQQRVDLKIAIDAEFNDWVQNRSEEDWLVVQGLPRLSSDLSNHDWQKAAKKQVTELIKFVLNIDRSDVNFRVLLVLNPFRHIPTRPPLYNVRMDSISSSQRIREIYSGFFRKERPMKLPASLKGVSVRNKITLNTKIRLAIMRELGSIYKDSNQGSSFKAHGHDTRPILITTPPRGAGRPRRYTFIQAVTTLKATFSDANLIKIFQNINDHHPGELQALFVVIRDDDRERIMELVQAERTSGSRGRSGQGSSQGHGSGANRTSTAPASTTSGFVFGAGSGMDLEANFISSLRSPPPPPPRPPGDVPNRDHHQVSQEKSKHPTKSRRSRSRDSDHEGSRARSRERSPNRARRSLSPVRKSRRSRSRESSSPGRGLKRNHQSSSRERDVDLKKRKRTRRRSSSTSSSGSESKEKKTKKKYKKDKKDKRHKHRRQRSSSCSSSGSRSSRSSKAESAAGSKKRG